MPLILSRAVPAGVVGNIPVRDGMHGRAGDLLLHLDETETRANAQVLAQQLDRARVKLARSMPDRDAANQPQIPREMTSRSDADDVGRLWASKVFYSTVARRLAEAPRSLPAEVFLQTGSRTMMSYLLKPITDQLLCMFN